MKRNAINIASTLLMVMIIAAVSAHAQLSARYRANIPFAFTANGKQFNAGDYWIGLFSSNSGFGPLLIHSGDGRVHGILTESPRDSPRSNEKAKLIFIRRGDSYTLAEVSTPDYRAKIRSPKMSTEHLASTTEIAARP